METERFSMYVMSLQPVFTGKSDESNSMDGELKSTLSSLQELLPSVFADKSEKQFVIAPDLHNKCSTALMYLDKSNFFLFYRKK